MIENGAREGPILCQNRRSDRSRRSGQPWIWSVHHPPRWAR